MIITQNWAFSMMNLIMPLVSRALLMKLGLVGMKGEIMKHWMYSVVGERVGMKDK